jgi:hypothetical protein
MSVLLQCALPPQRSTRLSIWRVSIFAQYQKARLEAVVGAELKFDRAQSPLGYCPAEICPDESLVINLAP